MSYELICIMVVSAITAAVGIIIIFTGALSVLRRKPKPTKILYRCDHKACAKCNRGGHGECDFTSNIQHARNFRRSTSGAYFVEE